MNEVELNEFRIARLLAAVNHVSQGNRTDFGRRLGYKDGAFVRQMIAGIRPITEKTVWAIEAMPGMKGWFDTEDVAVAPVESRRGGEWPFRSILEADIRALPATQLSELEGAIALAVAQLKLGINVLPPTPGTQPSSVAAIREHEPGGLVDMDHADDAFPMRTKGRTPAPWEGGKTQPEAERDPTIRLSSQTGVVGNVGAGEPPAANDKFEKVPELADVRLAAGDPIENHAEEQTGMIQFRRSFLKVVGADNGKARVVYAKGDSMEPVIRDGAALLVVPNESLTLRDLAAGGVYAINYDGRMIVKTVVRDKLTKRWVARSFNSNYPDIPLENGVPVRVLGQVVWAGSRLRDNVAGQWTRV
ncbi:LexA family transcriptional regulator [Achromobacter sp. ACM03]|uniref:S24 family peptidase n=1 Tax=Achromobacter sp. ACM03 TaxID=2769300 RepID=UPI0017845069|nr:S24 family peptidase [Achromobacter sp. ACM03]MBD9434210.1 LexA family transcriptional regulator [Achromobacter sp. ACM03]